MSNKGRSLAISDAGASTVPVHRAGLQASTLALTTHVGALMYDCTAVPHLARDSHASHVPEHPTVIKYVNQKERRVRRRRITGALVKKCGSSIECKTHHAGMEDQLGATQKCLNCMSWQSGANTPRLQTRWEASTVNPSTVSSSLSAVQPSSSSAKLVSSPGVLDYCVVPVGSTWSSTTCALRARLLSFRTPSV